MEFIVKIAAMLLIGLSLSALFRQVMPGFFPIFGTVVIAVSLALIFPLMLEISDKLSALYDKFELSMGIFTVFKVLAATTIGRVSGELCRDNNDKALGAVAELAGVVTAVICGLPLLIRAFEVVGGGF